MGSILVRMETTKGADASDLLDRLRRRFFITEPHGLGQFEITVEFVPDLEAARERVGRAAERIDPNWGDLVHFVAGDRKRIAPPLL